MLQYPPETTGRSQANKGRTEVRIQRKGPHSLNALFEFRDGTRLWTLASGLPDNGPAHARTSRGAALTYPVPPKGARSCSPGEDICTVRSLGIGQVPHERWRWRRSTHSARCSQGVRSAPPTSSPPCAVASSAVARAPRTVRHVCLCAVCACDADAHPEGAGLRRACRPSSSSPLGELTFKNDLRRRFRAAEGEQPHVMSSGDTRRTTYSVVYIGS